MHAQQFGHFAVVAVATVGFFGVQATAIAAHGRVLSRFTPPVCTGNPGDAPDCTRPYCTGEHSDAPDCVQPLCTGDKAHDASVCVKASGCTAGDDPTNCPRPYCTGVESDPADCIKPYCVPGNSDPTHCVSPHCAGKTSDTANCTAPYCTGGPHDPKDCYAAPSCGWPQDCGSAGTGNISHLSTTISVPRTNRTATTMRSNGTLPTKPTSTPCSKPAPASHPSGSKPSGTGHPEGTKPTSNPSANGTVPHATPSAHPGSAVSTGAGVRVAATGGIVTVIGVVISFAAFAL